MLHTGHLLVSRAATQGMAETFMAKITIEDISRETGLSRGTVSRALNDRPDISDRTKQRVLEACRKLNYVPSQAARSLATGRTYVVAVYVNDLSDPFATQFLRGVLTRADRANYNVHVVELPQDDAALEAAVPHLANQRVDGACVAASLDATRSRLVSEALVGRPVAATARLEGQEVDIFAPDDVECGRLAARCLRETCSGRLLFVASADAPGIASQAEGFREAAGENAAVEHWPTDDARVATWVDEQLLTAGGVVAADEVAALRVVLAMARRKRSIGAELPLVALGRQALLLSLQSTITTVECSGEEIGQRAMSALLERVAKTRLDAPDATLVAPRLIRRGSERQTMPA